MAPNQRAWSQIARAESSRKRLSPIQRCLVKELIGVSQLKSRRSSFQPVGKNIEFVQVETSQRAVRTGPLAGWTAGLFNTQIAFRSLDYRIHFFVGEERAALIADFDHANGFIGTIVKAGFAPYTGGRVNDHLATKRASVDRASGTANHANRIDAMHAGIRHHNSTVRRSTAQKTGIIIMSGCASSHTVVTSRAALEINDHSGGAIE